MSNIKLVLQFIKRRSWLNETHFALSTALGEQGPHHPHPQVPQPLPSRYAKVCCTTTKLNLIYNNQTIEHFVSNLLLISL